ncbi:hypothetical protein YC2023_074963 [Brassica napus]
MWGHKKKLSLWLYSGLSVIWCTLVNRRLFLNLHVCWQEMFSQLLLSLLSLLSGDTSERTFIFILGLYKTGAFTTVVDQHGCCRGLKDSKLGLDL